MKCHLLSFLVLLILLGPGLNSSGSILSHDFDSNQEQNTDSLKKRGITIAVKLNPFQPIFCEIPLSVEFFGKKNTSTQLQIGYIFPRYDAVLQQLSLHQGEEAMATNDGIFSYRTSPFNNYGLSSKVEFRGYHRKMFYSLQMTYKYCYYDNLIFHLHGAGMAYDQKESKDSYISGLGFIFGRQFVDSRIIMEWYMGGGIRFRSMNIVVHEITPVGRPGGTNYLNKKENETSLYPFVNLGYRFGFRFGKK